MEIVGQGLAGSCLAWALKWRGVEVSLVDESWGGAASRVAAGMVNPVTGKNFQASWRIAEFLPEAEAFYRRVEQVTGRRLWYPLPVRRLVSEKEWRKVEGKLSMPETARWVERVDENVAGWRAVVGLKGGGRLAVKDFCEVTRECFRVGGRKVEGASSEGGRVWCGGALGLVEGMLGEHRCAKGEILTVRLQGWDEGAILVGAGGWLVPLGGGLFKAGSTYEWEQLDGVATEAGRSRVEEILRALGVGEFEVVAHEAGVRPIVRRSMPLIGALPDGRVVFNGLGSKGSLYAPGVARRLAEHLVDGLGIEEDLDVGRWIEGQAGRGPDGKGPG